jgi:hypothetical protein
MLCKIRGFHGGDYKECRLLRPHIPEDGILQKVSSSLILFTLMMEVTGSSESAVLTRVAWRHIPDEAISTIPLVLREVVTELGNNFTS